MEEEKGHIGRPTNEEIKERKNKKLRKVILSIIIGIVLLFIIFSIGSVIYSHIINVKLKETATIEKDNIKITVLGSEKASINRELSLANGDYTKVKLTIENYGNDVFAWSTGFTLGDEIVSLKALGEEDSLPVEIPAGETVTGYLYFPTTDSEVLKYTSNIKVNNDGKGSVSRTYFKIK